MPNSRAFVIRSIKNGETSLIVSCYLEDIGYKTFIVKGVYSSKKSKFSKAHFFPLNIVNLNYSYSEGKNLGFIKEVKTEKLYKSLHLDIQKSSVIIFLSEILNSIFKEETLVNKDLFNFLLNSLSWYDQVKSCNNFQSLLISGAILFKDPVLKSKAGTMDLKNKVLFGEKGATQFEQLAAVKQSSETKMFSEEGHFFIKKGGEDQEIY